ncbi:ETS homologous factor-like [Entelurus aequoreus]|uniref:ETS homologous factor-like n=1 Tax=Entelurus aequoreus TaxID=161455 RepID=UPI002B1DECF2|nr:ETS homologous factor-like [Entelurus aequoreus]XP_061891676.1 ETS homologous factor-like [Entelurus aequoreus]
MSVTPLNISLDTQITTSNQWALTSCHPNVPIMMSGYRSGRLWIHDYQPQFWSKYQVWEWLQQVMDINQIDAPNIPFQNFDMDGHQLCKMTYQDFVRAAGSLGPILFHGITQLKWNGDHAEINQPELKPELDIPYAFSDVSSPQIEVFDSLIPPHVSPSLSSPEIQVSYNRPQQVKKHSKYNKKT